MLPRVRSSGSLGSNSANSHPQDNAESTRPKSGANSPKAKIRARSPRESNGQDSIDVSEGEPPEVYVKLASDKDSVRGYKSKKGSKSPRALPKSLHDAEATQKVPTSMWKASKSHDAVAHQRLLLFLTSLPLALAFFVFFFLEPPLEGLDTWRRDEGPHGNDNSSSSSGSTDGVQDGRLSPLSLGCPQAVKKNFLFPARPWHASFQPRDSPKLGIMTTTAAGMDQILPWLYYHRTLGVEVFLIFAEGQATTAENVAALTTIPGVRVIPRTSELDERQQYKPGRNKTLIWDMAGKPCNYELFVKQAMNGDTAIPMAMAEALDWLIHIDTDELLYPAGTPDFSLQTLLAGVNRTTNYVVFSNYESIVERDDVKEPFLEVTLFKKNPGHVHKDMFGKYAREAVHGNPNYMLAYGNGKSAARVLPGLRSNGAHRFNNPSKTYKEKTFKESAVLHYSYTMFSDLTSRSKRCHCKPTRKALKTCFFLEFDRQAYIVASTQTQEQMLQWYRRRVVWSNRTSVMRLLRAGIFERTYTPQLIMRGIISSGIIEATLQGGQEEMRHQQHQQGSAQGAPESSHRSVEGAWGYLLNSAYGLMSSAKQSSH